MFRESLIFQLKPGELRDERHKWFDAAEGSLAAAASKNIQVLKNSAALPNVGEITIYGVRQALFTDASPPQSTTTRAAAASDRPHATTRSIYQTISVATC
jgi:hypothetical protein